MDFSTSELQCDSKLVQGVSMSATKLNRIIHLTEATKGVCDLIDDG